MDSETAGLPNLLAGKSIVVELRQADATASKLTEEAWSLLTNNKGQTRMKEELRALSNRLGERGAIKRAAQAILSIIEDNSRSSAI